MPQTTGTVLITDGEWRKSLSTTRALGRAGIQTTVSAGSVLATSHFSKFCGRRLIFPSAEADPQKFLERVLKELQTRQYDVLMPMEDLSVEICIRNRKVLERYTRLPFPTIESFQIASDKSQTTRIAEDLDIPTPKTYYISNSTELTRLAGKLSYPVIIKPRRGSGSHGIRIVQSERDFLNRHAEVHKIYPWPIIQELIPYGGGGYGASFLFDQTNNSIASFAHKRIREYPVNGGPSTLRESIPGDEIKEMGVKLLKAIGWEGVAMVEFMRDPRDGQYKFLEINPRFWGSLELAVVSGINFPLLLYKSALGENFETPLNYSLGMKCRWLLPGDLLHFLSNPNRFSLKPSFFDFRDGNTRYDILSLDDVGPVIARLLTMLSALFRPTFWKYIKRRKT